MAKKSLTEALLADLNINQIVKKIKNSISSVEGLVDQKIQTALGKFALPTSQELKLLSKRVDELNERVDKLIHHV